MTPIAETEQDSDSSWQQDALRQVAEQEERELQEMQEAAEAFEQERREEEARMQSEAVGPPSEPSDPGRAMLPE
eukprot:2291114-Alexandrium_andersonii.AAC.1